MLLTNGNKMVVVRACSIIAAKLILERYTKDSVRWGRKLKLTDLMNEKEPLLVLANEDFI